MAFSHLGRVVVPTVAAASTRWQGLAVCRRTVLWIRSTTPPQLRETLREVCISNSDLHQCPDGRMARQPSVDRIPFRRLGIPVPRVDVAVRPRPASTCSQADCRNSRPPQGYAVTHKNISGFGKFRRWAGCDPVVPRDVPAWSLISGPALECAWGGGSRYRTALGACGGCRPIARGAEPNARCRGTLPRRRPRWQTRINETLRRAGSRSRKTGQPYAERVARFVARRSAPPLNAICSLPTVVPSSRPGWSAIEDAPSARHRCWPTSPTSRRRRQPGSEKGRLFSAAEDHADAIAFAKRGVNDRHHLVSL
jgi:hypothetical protein